MRSDRLLTIAAITAAMLLSGCGGNASTRSTASPSASPPVSEAATSPDPSAAESAGTDPSSAAPTTTTPTSTGSSCTDPGLSSVWASWPMPNPKNAGLPHPASYTDLGNGMVKDNVTCLVWQKQSPSGTYTWAAAKTYCSSLELGGGGWHLPSRVELTSLTDFTRAGPAIDTSAFPNAAPAFFWTSSPWVVSHNPPFSWIINFYEGLASNAADQNGAYRVRCVRSPGGSGPATYRTVANGEAQDTHTGLIWQQAGSSGIITATAAGRYCADLALGGHSWRLPSIKELATTVDESRVAPAINVTVFPNTAKSTWYWSSSVAKPDPTKTWALNYDDGYTNYRTATTGYVRCVR